MAVREEQSTDRRALILDAAVGVISARGVDNARLADVAEAAGVSLGLVQHYFRTRDRLLGEVFRREQERISAIWYEAVPADEAPLLRLAEYLRLASPEGGDSAATAFDPGWSFWLEFWSKANRDEAIRAEFTDIYEDFRKLFIDAIRAGVRADEFTVAGSVDDAADRLISLIDGTAIRTLLGDLDRKRMLKLLIDSAALELGLTTAQKRRLARHATRP